MTVLLGFLPVALFLLSLLYLDSYKLVRLGTVLQLILLGCIAATAGFFLNHWLLQMGIDRRLLTRFVAPAIEEILKAIPILWMIRTRRIGFLIDAAIDGFAIGAGFALAENLYYLTRLSDASPALWVVRGFGTAVMHGGTAAIMAVTAKALSERKRSVVPGPLIAFVLHSVFNHFVLSPTLSTVVIVVVLPPLMIAVFSQSERYLRDWLGTGFDLDSEVLRAMKSGEFAETPAGQYLQSLREHFEGAVLADMLCYLRLLTELSLRMKGVLMLRASGFPVKRDAEVAEKLAEMHYLQENIGKTGELALAPLLHRSPQDLWELQALERGE
ncbi:MAG TPA: PrsW family glutamic-type intramembrane protease [Thermoanaerobaculia bacterium]